jgi:hypothetical protein
MHRPIVIAGSLAQFADWCRVHQTNPIAAIYVRSEAELRSALCKTRDVFLWGDYDQTPAYRAWRLKQAA